MSVSGIHQIVREILIRADVHLIVSCATVCDKYFRVLPEVASPATGCPPK